jgi:hypothetical protein
MRYLLFFLFFVNTLYGQNFTHSGYVYNSFGTGMNNVPVKLYISNKGGMTGTLSKITSGIPSDRGRGTTVLYSTANTDETSVAITFPSGFSPSFGGSTYTNGHVNANSWFTFGTTSSSGFNGNGTNPNKPTIHIGSVDNGSTDNNVSYVSTESYIDATYGDVFRVRYEGNCRYNQTGVNYIWDLYFIKSQPDVQLVVWRTFTADGSNQEQMGISSGNAWVSVNYITAGTYSGTSWKIQTGVSSSGSATYNSTVYTNSSGYYSFSTVLSTSTYNFNITLDTIYPKSNKTLIDLNNLILKKRNITGIDYYIYDLNNNNQFTVADLYLVKKTNKSLIFTSSQITSINSTTSNLKSTYLGLGTFSFTNVSTGGTSNFYLIPLTFPNQIITF